MGQSSQQTIIAQGVKVEGDFTSQGAVIIEGEVTGSVQTSENLQVGETARIHADVAATDAVVAGEIRGNIVIEGRLDLLETSQVTGAKKAAANVKKKAKKEDEATEEMPKD